MRSRRSVLLSIAGATLLCCRAGADNEATPTDEMTAIVARTFNGYTRTKQDDGSFTPETYGVAVGGLITGSPGADEQGFSMLTGDASIDRTSFVEVAGVVEQALKPMRYVPTSDPKAARLLIVVFWGRTGGSNSFSGSVLRPDGKDGASKDLTNLRNATLLGFDQEGHLFDAGFDDPSNMMANIRREVHKATLDAVEDDRYLVILEAFDFQKIWKQKKPVRLWETRFSLSQRHDDFRADLPRMAAAAEQFFGTNNPHISYKGVPDGQVEIGSLKSLGVVKGP
jgi:hypothetical protein